MKKSITRSLPTNSSIAFACGSFGGLCQVTPASATHIKEQINDAVDHSMDGDGIIVCVNRPDKIQLYADG